MKKTSTEKKIPQEEDYNPWKLQDVLCRIELHTTTTDPQKPTAHRVPWTQGCHRPAKTDCPQGAMDTRLPPTSKNRLPIGCHGHKVATNQKKAWLPTGCHGHKAASSDKIVCPTGIQSSNNTHVDGHSTLQHTAAQQYSVANVWQQSLLIHQMSLECVDIPQFEENHARSAWNKLKYILDSTHIYITIHIPLEIRDSVCTKVHIIYVNIIRHNDGFVSHVQMSQSHDPRKFTDENDRQKIKTEKGETDYNVKDHFKDIIKDHLKKKVVKKSNRQEFIDSNSKKTKKKTKKTNSVNRLTDFNSKKSVNRTQKLLNHKTTSSSSNRLTNGLQFIKQTEKQTAIHQTVWWTAMKQIDKQINTAFQLLLFHATHSGTDIPQRFRTWEKKLIKTHTENYSVDQKQHWKFVLTKADLWHGKAVWLKKP